MSKRNNTDIFINHYLKKEDKKLLKIMRRHGVTVSNDLIFDITRRICELIERHNPEETPTSEEQNYYIRDLNTKKHPYDFTPDLTSLTEFRLVGDTQAQEELIKKVFAGLIEYSKIKDAETKIYVKMREERNNQCQQ